MWFLKQFNCILRNSTCRNFDKFLILIKFLKVRLMTPRSEINIREKYYLLFVLNTNTKLPRKQHLKAVNKIEKNKL